MFKFAELRETYQNKKHGLKIKIRNLREKSAREYASDAKGKVKKRVEENRAEEQVKIKSNGPLNLEYTNNWRESVNRFNDDGRLEFECYFKRIKGQSGDFYVFNLRTANLVGGHSKNQFKGSENVEENSTEENQTDDIQEDEGDTPDELPSELTLTVEDDDGMLEKFDVSLTPEEESDGEEEIEGKVAETQDELRKPDSVDELYLDICEIYADNPSEEEEDVYVPFQHPVVRNTFQVSDLTEAEEVAEDTIQRLDERTIESILEDADADDDLKPDA